ncbi:hypothetical protein BDV28DRAFT_146633 [Aspergillus coremiiformis]|uniref:Uncharacterized protein n=1 Tax=Aspergillus coremiiformis TaxID=138285 RepID=A0A5N6ZBX4_9EURO|nr:hypothetical protein BDV28DRAFT_146633 [Aspergillus coremiiformis]
MTSTMEMRHSYMDLLTIGAGPAGLTATSWASHDDDFPVHVRVSVNGIDDNDPGPISDIRYTCSIRSSDGGSMLVVPRENGSVVGFCLYMKGGEGLHRNVPKKSEESLNAVIQSAQKTLRQYPTCAK